MVFKQIGTEVSFLSKSFKDIKKDFSSGLGIKQSLFSFISQNDIKALNDFEKAIRNSSMAYKQAFDTYLSKAPIAIKRQANEIIKLTNQQRVLNAQRQAGKITEEQYNTAITANKAKMQALTTQTQSLTLSQKAATVASKGLSIAMNLLGNIAIMGIITLISKGVKALSDLANHIEITREKVDDLRSTFKSALDTANSNAKRVEELADRYDELSDGVNNLGENVSLTNEEYEEYNTLVNEIADMFPTLVQGYTDEGNAILNLKGNVEALRDAYKEAQQEAYNLLIANGQDSDGNDIIKQWQDTQDTGFWADLFDFGMDDINKGISVQDAIEQLKAIQNMSAERYREIERIVGSGSIDEIGSLSNIEQDIGYGSYLSKALGLTWDISDEDFAEAKKQAKILVQTYNAEIESALSDVKTLAKAYLMTNEDYDKLDESSKNAASVIVNSFNADIANGFKDKTDVGKYVAEIVKAFDNQDVKNAANNLFNLDTSTMSVKDARAEINKYIDIIAKEIGEDSENLKIRLGFEDIDDALNRAKNKFMGRLTPNDSYTAQINSFLESLSPEDLEAALNIPDLFADGLDGATAKIEAWKSDPNNKIDISFNYATYSKQVDDIVNNVDKVQSALDSLNSGKSLEAKDIAELANAFPSYSTKILSAANDTEKLKSVLSGIKREAPQDLINTLTNLKGLSQEDQKAVNGLISVLSQLNSVTSAYTNTLSDLDTKESLLSSTYKEMHDDGEISLGTYQKLLSLGEDYADLVSIVDGKMIVNIQSLKELTQKKYEDEIATLKLTKAELEHNIAIDPKNANTYYEKIRAIEEDIKAKKYALGLFNSYDYAKDGKETKSEAEDLFDEQQKYFENRVSELEAQIDITTNDSTDDQGNSLNAKEKFDYIRDIYREILAEIENRINDIVQAGVEGHEDALKELEKQLDEYKEKLSDVFKSAVEEEKDYIENLKDNYSDSYDERIDKIKEQQKAAEESAQAEIDAVQEKIDALEKANEVEQEANDLIEARQNLEKASQRTRKVYGADGTVTYKNDPQKIKEAQESYNKALLNQQVRLLEDQKDALEKTKDKQSEAYDAIITNLESQKEEGERQFDILLKALDEYLNPDKSTSNVDVWSQLAKMQGAQYKNGVWTDKDGNKINLEELMKSAETKSDDKKKAETNNNNSKDKDNKSNTAITFEGFLSRMEKTLNLKAGSLTPENVNKIFANSPSMNYNPYEVMKDKTGIANREYVSNVNNNNNAANVTIGDININNPVGNSNDLAKELMMNLPNAFQNQMYTNLKK